MSKVNLLLLIIKKYSNQEGNQIEQTADSTNSNIIAESFSNNNVENYIAENNQAKNSVSNATEQSNADYNIIIVAPGDTVYSLSRKYKIATKDIINANNMRYPFLLKLGQSLKLPKTHNNSTVSNTRSFRDSDDSKFKIITIISGDTIFSIAREYSLSPNEIIKINNLKSPYLLKLHQDLKIPATAIVNKNASKSTSNNITNKNAITKKYRLVKPASYRKIITIRGDYLEKIEKRTSTLSKDIISINNLKKPYKLQIKQKIYIPVYKVFKNLGFKNSDEILAEFKISKKDFMRINNIKSYKNSPPPVTFRIPYNKEDRTVTFNNIQASRKNKFKKTSAKVGRFFWPLRGKILIGYHAKINGTYHDGINIKAYKNAKVRASSVGTVAYIGNEITGYGNLIVIKHANNFLTAYAHLAKIFVKYNQKVTSKTIIGLAGKTGGVTQPQIYFSIRKNNKPLNPFKYLK